MKTKFYYKWWFITLCFLSIYLLPLGIILWILKTRNLQKELGAVNERYENLKDGIEAEWAKIKSENIEIAKNQEQLRIKETEIQALRASAVTIVEDATNKANHIVAEAKDQADSIVIDAQNKATSRLEQADIKASTIVANAERKISALTSAIRAMKNTIEGYGDEYLMPASNALDGLAEHFGFSDASKKYKESRSVTKRMIREGEAAICDYIEGQKNKTACDFVIDAFNGRVDSAISKVKSGENFGKSKQAILDAFAIVNNQGQAFRNARITNNFLNARLQELRWSVVLLELKKKEQEEQREIKERMREEARLAAEIEKAEREARKEEQRIREAEAKLSQALETATSEQRERYENELKQLREKLKIAEDKFGRARSMAELTKSGFVYIISNIGSFGQQVFKIGMTRRLEPEERIHELGNASVPFPFDIHAMIYSKDAPALENRLHEIFNDKRVNKVNLRKEFFRVPIEEIRNALNNEGVEDVKFTLIAQAEEYRETLNLQK